MFACPCRFLWSLFVVFRIWVFIVLVFVLVCKSFLWLYFLSLCLILLFLWDLFKGGCDGFLYPCISVSLQSFKTRSLSLFYFSDKLNPFNNHRKESSLIQLWTVTQIIVIANLVVLILESTVVQLLSVFLLSVLGEPQTGSKNWLSGNAYSFSQTSPLHEWYIRINCPWFSSSEPCMTWLPRLWTECSRWSDDVLTTVCAFLPYRVCRRLASAEGGFVGASLRASLSRGHLRGSERRRRPRADVPVVPLLVRALRRPLRLSVFAVPRRQLLPQRQWPSSVHSRGGIGPIRHLHSALLVDAGRRLAATNSDSRPRHPVLATSALRPSWPRLSLQQGPSRARSCKDKHQRRHRQRRRGHVA